MFVDTCRVFCLLVVSPGFERTFDRGRCSICPEIIGEPILRFVQTKWFLFCCPRRQFRYALSGLIWYAFVMVFLCGWRVTFLIDSVLFIELSTGSISVNFRLKCMELQCARSWNGYTHVSDRWCCSQTGNWYTLAIHCSHLIQEPAFSGGFCIREFDDTKGFPGEGPWTISTINVGSLEKHDEIYLREHNCVAIQETRITDANAKKCHFQAASHERDLSCGPHLGYLPSGHPEWGGVAIATDAGTSLPFTAKHDALGIWPSLWASARVCAQWVAASPSTNILVISFYGYPNAGDVSMRNSTNQLLQQILHLCSQFGNIPIAICGDFQDIPHNYPALRAAFEQGLWFDTLMMTDQDGNNRDITFSRNRKWENNAGPQSSIDGILVNETAFRYVSDTQVSKTKGLQHAFVSVSFQWPDSNQNGRVRGFRWVPHAAFDLSGIKPLIERECVAGQLWISKFAYLSDQAQDAQQLMEVANNFAIEVLLQSGAKWKKGKRIRGEMPEPEVAGNDQPMGDSCDAKSKLLNRLTKTLARIDDLAFKIDHQNPSPNCLRIATTAWKRVCRALDSFQIPHKTSWPNHEDLLDIWQKVSDRKEVTVLQIRRERASAWKKRMEHSAVTDYRDIFKFLKLKHRVPTHAVVTNRDNLPIYNPQDAISLAREQWNPIFDVHKDPIPTQPFENVVGPLLDEMAKPCSLEDIKPFQLHKAIQSRPNEAAGGVDGWRTTELKSLPAKCFISWAKIWNMIEIGKWSLPQVFQIARLTMLPKPGAKTMQPIDRRLINLLNIHYLLWSKVRFQHLTKWQQEVFPRTVCGGVKGRQTSDIAHHIGVANELAISTNTPVVGVKIDRSKCFDRIAINIVVCIARKLGLPERYLNVWTQLYQNFRRFLTLGQYIDDTLLASSNGVAQGDSASVLAVNLLMSAWTAVLKVFPNIQSFVFIDDAYLLAGADHLTELAQAVQTTKLFDSLVGQKFNPEKSAGWATSKRAKKDMAQLIPDIPCSDFTAVLGAFVKSCSKTKTFDTIAHGEIIRQVLKDIFSLPVGLKQKAFLVGSKVISKMLYLPELNPWARLSLDSFQSNILGVLWGDRPHWRCAELVFALLTNPVRSHPQHAIAAQVIMNIASRCRKDNRFFQLWCSLCLAKKVITKGLLDALLKACATLNLNFTPPESIEFLGQKFSFLEVTPRLLRRILRVASVQSLYKAAITSSRKDLQNWGSGVIDSDLSVFREPCKPWKLQGLDSATIVGPMVGACPTANRLYKGGLLTTPRCRFCSECDYEDIRHLTGECRGTRELLGNPGNLFPDQPNYLSHGIREVPQFLLDTWARTVPPTVSSPAANPYEAVRVWGDGSVCNGDHFFSKTLAFALINQDGSTILTKGWQDPLGCSYKAELFALLHCVQIFLGDIEFTTDCSSLIRVWGVVRESSELPDNLAYREIWFNIRQTVFCDGHDRLKLLWVKAHQVDSGLVPMTETQRNNRVADQVASSTAKAVTPIDPSIVASWRHHSYNHWIWLCKLTKAIASLKPKSEDRINDPGVDPPNEVAPPSSSSLNQEDAALRNRFSKWDWGLDEQQYTWSSASRGQGPPKKWPHSPDLWVRTVEFLGQLKWRTGDCAVSIYCIAFLFWIRTKIIPPTLLRGTEGTFHLMVQWMRQVLKELNKLKVEIYPSSVKYCIRSTMHSSQYFPCGVFQKGRIYMTSHEKTLWAKFVASLPEGGKRAKH